MSLNALSLPTTLSLTEQKALKGLSLSECFDRYINTKIGICHLKMALEQRYTDIIAGVRVCLEEHQIYTMGALLNDHNANSRLYDTLLQRLYVALLILWAPSDKRRLYDIGQNSPLYPFKKCEEHKKFYVWFKSVINLAFPTRTYGITNTPTRPTGARTPKECPLLLTQF